jgi:hypothetical protein
MGVLTEEQLEHVWEEKGLKRRMIKFREFLIERGMSPISVNKHIFLDHIKEEVLYAFFVKGVKYTEDGRIEYEPD